MATATNLGFPRIGPQRELKRAVERFWAAKIDEAELGRVAQSLRKLHWQWQDDAGLDHIPTGDFSFYDHMLDMSAMVGAVPPRFGQPAGEIDVATYFRMARGVAGEDREALDKGIPAMEMTKWFDTNYHYLVPELDVNQPFRLASNKPIDEFHEARQQGVRARPVLVGPVTYLLLSKCRGGEFDRLSLLDPLLVVYEQVLSRLGEAGAEWVQMDEPCLACDLPPGADEALKAAYARLSEASSAKLLVATYFGSLDENADTALALPVAGLHVDLVRGPTQLDVLLPKWPEGMTLSAGLVDGRNVWRADLAAALTKARQAADAVGSDRLMIGPSCSLLHSPVDLDNETKLDDELRSWMAFARQKLEEITTLTSAINDGPDAVREQLDANAQAMASRRSSPRTHDDSVRQRMAAIGDNMLRRKSPFNQRQMAQREALRLPVLPTTTIGSFPQTSEIRKTRAAFRRGEVDRVEYERFMRDEIATLTNAINNGADSVREQLDANAQAMASRRNSPRTHDDSVRQRMAAIGDNMLRRKSPFAQRQMAQRDALGLPMLPTTTIGSFPQTSEIRKTRAAFRRGEVDRAEYERFMRDEIARCVRIQDEIGLDVLVHGEAERNDMVEYFGEQMTGFATSQNGWVQSYGSRCVKPPIIYGDVKRPAAMTVDWIRHAASQTQRPVKGMLTGPVTILGWSFVRDDQPEADTCRQIGLAIRDEVDDLEQSGVTIIQIDEPAFREGLPLRQRDRDGYLQWAVDCFRLASCSVADTTQIHTHMCYCEFNDTLPSIAAMDADVISIETSRSDMELLDAFAQFKYPNEIGPGVYDIHSPQIPSRESIERLLRKAMEVLDVGQLWVNPDCGLKTRRWEEVEPSLRNMVAATESLREEITVGTP